MSSAAISRQSMTPLVRRWRGYFAPVNRNSSAPTIFDPARDGAFDLDTPPAGWFDAGWIENFKRVQGTKTEPVRSGSKGAANEQVRSELDSRVELDFRQWGKLQMALASGAEHMNVLASTGATGINTNPSGGTADPAIAIQSGSNSSTIVVGASAPSFSAGEMVAVDVDYGGQTGYVGTGVSAAYVKYAAGVGVDYVRRVTFNVARIAQVTTNSLILSQPLLGGVPASTAKMQKVVGFADREGGSFFQEWSGLFVAFGQSGERLCFYYPRLQVNAAREATFDVTDPLQAIALRAGFIALPYTDANDGQIILCCRSYFPAKNAAVY